MGSFSNDLRYACRTLLQNRTFTITAVAALALGIGANTAIFSVINTVLLEPLPYPDSDRIVVVGRAGGGQVPEPVFAFWEQNNAGFEDLAACRAGAHLNLHGPDRPELVAAVSASRSYFRLFGANPIMGRTFTAAEDSPGGPRVVVISHGLWQRGFNGDSEVLGKTITLGGASYAVAGVLSPTFKPYPPADAWIPLQTNSSSTNQAATLTVFGRLAGGITITQATAKMVVLGKRYAETRSRVFGDPDIRVVYLHQRITGDIRPSLLILIGAVGLVLLIACANVANLLLARATARRKEIAIRAALGAGRGRIVRQLLTESLLLASASGVLGLVLGSWGFHTILAFAAGELPRLQELATVSSLDPRVAAFTFSLAGITGVLFGLFPAIDLSRTEFGGALKESGGRASASRGQNHARGLLIASEVAIAVVLLCGSVLLIRSLVEMHRVNLGFEPRNLLTMEVSLAGSGYAKSSTVDRLATQFVARVERIPDVESAAMASALPLQGGIDMIFNIPGQALPEGRHFSGDVQWRIVSRSYFEVLRIPLLAGRLFREREGRGTVVISKTMARKFWPDSNPVGQVIVIGPELSSDYHVGTTEIIGVVGDVRERLYFEPQPVMYQMPSQIPDGDMALVNSLESTGILVRTRPGVASISVSQAVQQALLAGAQLPSAKVRTMDRVSIDSTAQRNFSLLLLGAFSGVALLLAAVGIYGVMSFSVEQRTHEIGIRTALGANRSDILYLVLHQALRMSVAGITIGIAASFGLTRLLQSQLFGVTPSDPLTFATVPVILLVIALAAAWVPAMQATRIDPLTALRHE